MHQLSVVNADLAFENDEWIAAQKRDKFCSELVNSLYSYGADGIQLSIPNAVRPLMSKLFSTARKSVVLSIEMPTTHKVRKELE